MHAERDEHRRRGVVAGAGDEALDRAFGLRQLALPAIGRGADEREFVVDFTFDNCLAFGEYSINVGIGKQGMIPTFPSHKHSEEILDATFGGLVFFVQHYERARIWGKVRIPVKVARPGGEA